MGLVSAPYQFHSGFEMMPSLGSLNYETSHLPSFDEGFEDDAFAGDGGIEPFELDVSMDVNEVQDDE